MTTTRVDFLVNTVSLEGKGTSVSGMQSNAEVALELCAKMEEILANDAFIGFSDEKFASYVRHLFKYGQHMNEHDGPVRDIKGELAIHHWSRKS